jgi:hypothetical protein
MQLIFIMFRRDKSGEMIDQLNECQLWEGTPDRTKTVDPVGVIAFNWRQMVVIQLCDNEEKARATFEVIIVFGVIKTRYYF